MIASSKTIITCLVPLGSKMMIEGLDERRRGTVVVKHIGAFSHNAMPRVDMVQKARLSGYFTLCQAAKTQETFGIDHVTSCIYLMTREYLYITINMLKGQINEQGKSHSKSSHSFYGHQLIFIGPADRRWVHWSGGRWICLVNEAQTYGSNGGLVFYGSTV
jgi:hypothetical protein